MSLTPERIRQLQNCYLLRSRAQRALDRAQQEVQDCEARLAALDKVIGEDRLHPVAATPPVSHSQAEMRRHWPLHTRIRFGIKSGTVAGYGRDNCYRGYLRIRFDGRSSLQLCRASLVSLT